MPSLHYVFYFIAFALLGDYHQNDHNYAIFVVKITKVNNKILLTYYLEHNQASFVGKKDQVMAEKKRQSLRHLTKKKSKLTKFIININIIFKRLDKEKNELTQRA